MIGIRDAAAGDAHDIADVHVEAWQVGYRGLVPDELLDGLSVPGRTEYWSRTLSLPGNPGVLVATDAEAVVGFAAVGPDREVGDPQRGELYALYLRPIAWGRGIGRALHGAALDRLRALGHERAGLWMLAGNVRALRFYERAGWRGDGRSKLVPAGDGPPLDHRGLSRSLLPDQ